MPVGGHEHVPVMDVSERHAPSVQRGKHAVETVERRGPDVADGVLGERPPGDPLEDERGRSATAETGREALEVARRDVRPDLARGQPAPEHDPDRSDPGGLLAAMLSRHGVRAEISIIAKTLPRVSDVLCRHVRDRSADLVVMGAYGHSRFLEEILGGATRNMLAESHVPVIMAH